FFLSSRGRHTRLVGDWSSDVCSSDLSPTVEARALAALGLRPETVATQIVGRDRHAEVLCALVLLGTAIEQIALGVRHWQRTEVRSEERRVGKGGGWQKGAQEQVEVGA